jgi:hypothetical protein
MNTSSYFYSLRNSERWQRSDLNSKYAVRNLEQYKVSIMEMTDIDLISAVAMG